MKYLPSIKAFLLDIEGNTLKNKIQTIGFNNIIKEIFIIHII